MLMAQNGDKKIEEYIVELLHEKEITGPTLLKHVLERDFSISKETFYRTLRRLLEEEVITKQKKIYQINRQWLQRIYHFSKKYTETNEAMHDIVSLEDGDKITYKFKNPILMGIFWTHAYNPIFNQHNPKTPILVYHPHEWLIYARAQSELFFLSRFKDDKKVVFFALGSNSLLDKQFKQNHSNSFVQVGLGIKLGLKNTEYINVLGDFIFKISVSKRFSDDIDSFFKKYTIINQENYLELEKLCNRKDQTKITLLRSKKEAEKWRIKFNKYFYIPKI
ncbi:MAG: hypothetical protein WCQ32_00775 [bacterium]